MENKKYLFLVLLLLAGLLFSTNCFAAPSVDYNWKNVSIGGGGFVSSVIAAPNDRDVFYARTDVGGAYRWDESAQAWIPLLDWVSTEERGYLGVDGIAVDPSVPGRVYMLLGIGYFSEGRSAFVRSDDYGNTWDVFDVTDKFKAHGNGMGRGNGERVAVDPNNSNIIFVGSRQNGLWKSTNRGETWTQLSLDYTPNQNRDMHESGVCTIQFDKNDVSGGVTRTIYAGVSRETENVYVSHDAGATWSLVPGQPTAGKIRPQRIALTPDGRYLYVTYANGAGPHPMLWSGVTDYFNRGAIYKCDTEVGAWTDVSPEDFMQNLDQVTNDETHLGAFSGISIDPNNPDRLLATAINSWRAPQFWAVGGSWIDSWGDNIYLSEDGGETWREMFRYYWMDGGFYPDYDMINEGGFPWIIGEKVHWNGAITFDPFNSERAFVASGNGVFSTDNLSDSYTSSEWVDNVEQTLEHGKATWTFTARGIEETVPLGMVSLPGGSLVSVIGDYDGFVHEELDQPSPYGRLQTIVNGQVVHLGSTTGLAYAGQKPDVLAKAGPNKATANGQDIAICGVTISNDGGVTWEQIYNKPGDGSFSNGQVALSADGAVVLWAPKNGDSPVNELYRYINSGWSKCEGVSFSSNPEADKVNANLMYAYSRTDGYMYVSEDKGATFTRRGQAGTSDYWTAVSAPGIEGEIWVPLSYAGLTRSSDAGATFSSVNGVTWCESVGFGKEAPGADFPTVYIYGTVDSVTGVFRSTDQGGSWVRVNDDQHQYGGPGNASMVIGDMNVFGRVYMSTAGRGIVYGEPSGSGNGSGTTVSVTGVSVAPASASISIGGSTQLTATVTPANATNKAVNWRSSNPSVATVGSNGLVTGVAPGNATITVTTVSGSRIAMAQIEVSSVAVGGISVRPTSVTLDPSETRQLTATVSPSNATNKSVAWSSSDDSIATAGADGLVTGMSAGTATITATTVEGGLTATASVTVNFVEMPVTGVTLSPASQLIQPGGTITLSVAFVPVTATNKGLSWSSSNPDVASVDDAGRVTANAEGETTITVTTDDGGFTAVSTITVSTVSTGTIVAEYWKEVSGQSVGDLTSNVNYPDSPSDTEVLTSLEIAANQAENYGTRIHGFIYPPATGNYTFYVAGDDNCDLYLSSDDSEANAVRIAFVEGWADPRQWDKYESQKSAAIALEAGKKYYIKVLHKESFGGDSLAVAWEGPGISLSVIDGVYLSPFDGSTGEPVVKYSLATNTIGSGSISVSPNGNSYDAGTEVTLTATAASGYVFSGWSGDAGGASATTILVMNSNKTVTATFTAVADTDTDEQPATETDTGMATSTETDTGTDTGFGGCDGSWQPGDGGCQ